MPISNIFTERIIWDAVILRKTSLGNHSLKGAQDSAINLSVMGSCKILGLNPTEYLEYVCKKFLAKEPVLTPHQYLLLRDKLHGKKAPLSPVQHSESWTKKALGFPGIRLLGSAKINSALSN